MQEIYFVKPGNFFFIACLSMLCSIVANFGTPPLLFFFFYFDPNTLWKKNHFANKFIDSESNIWWLTSDEPYLLKQIAPTNRNENISIKFTIIGTLTLSVGIYISFPMSSVLILISFDLATI